VTLAGALLAGLLSFLSPCVLPLVPAYLSYISGVSVNELRQHESTSVRRHALMQSLWFVSGFSLVFIALGVSATLLGQRLLMHMDYSSMMRTFFEKPPAICWKSWVITF